MTTPSARGRIAGRDAHLRAADADREQVADQLRAGHADGRLDLSEFQQRLERCYEAKTFGELAALVSDLPGEEPADRIPPRGLGPRPRHLLPLVALAFVLMIASAAAWHHGHHPPFFLIFPVLFLLWRFSFMRRRRWSGATRGGPGRWA